jgi:hypothetical protein
LDREDLAGRRNEVGAERVFHEGVVRRYEELLAAFKFL